jgi:hypothetical protein
VSFNFELIGNPAPPPSPPQEIYLATFDGQPTLGWGDASFRLQRSDKVTGPWTNSPASSPFPIVPSGQHEFYRLTKP